jgi:hypothetical protein
MEFKEWLSKQYLLAGATAAAMLGTALSSPVPPSKSKTSSCSSRPSPSLLKRGVFCKGKVPDNETRPADAKNRKSH